MPVPPLCSNRTGRRQLRMKSDRRVGLTATLSRGFPTFPTTSASADVQRTVLYPRANKREKNSARRRTRAQDGQTETSFIASEVRLCRQAMDKIGRQGHTRKGKGYVGASECGPGR